MSREYLISIDEPGAWKTALNNIPHSYWHTWNIANALMASTGNPAFLYVYEDMTGEVQAVCPYSVREWNGTYDIYTTGGFAGFCSREHTIGIHEKWHSFAAKKGYICGYMALHPKTANINYTSNTKTRNDLFFLDLRQGLDRMKSKFNDNVKRSIKRWEKDGSPAETDRDILRDFLLQEYYPFMLKIGANSETTWSQNTLISLCDDPSVLMVGMCDTDGLCAVGVFGTSIFGAEYLLNINIRNGRSHTAAMIWWAVQELISMRVSWLNLGGGITADDSLAKAKIRYRPERLPFIISREIYRLDEYRQLCIKSDVDPSVMESFFPPYRKPHAK